MKKEINEYIDKLKNKKKLTKEEKEELMVRIKFYQHERLIHLIVTQFTGISTILFLLGFLILESIPLLLLFILTLALFIPYIFHYYFLENSTQKLQRLYLEV